MAKIAHGIRGIATAAFLAAGAVALSGCAGSDGVELNGKLFEAVGLAGDAFGKKEEPRTQTRAPLVLPPDPNRLPEPGGTPPPAVADQSWPKDAQQQKVADEQARKKAQEAYCKDGNWKQKAVKDDIAADRGPDGSCNGSIFSVLGKALGTSD